jgi:hypothetical protein
MLSRQEIGHVPDRSTLWRKINEFGSRLTRWKERMAKLPHQRVMQFPALTNWYKAHGVVNAR